MIDDFLTTPDELPPLRSRRPSARPLAAEAAPSSADARPGGTLAGSALAASVLLVVAMISLPSFEPVATLSKTPHGPWRVV